MEIKLGKVTIGKAAIIIGVLFFCYIIGSVVYFSYLRTTIIFQENQLSRLLRTASSGDVSLLDQRGNLSLNNDQIDNQVSSFISEIDAMRNEMASMRDALNEQKERQNNEIIFDIVRNSIDPDTKISYSEYIQRNVVQQNINNQYNWSVINQSNNMFLVSLTSSSGGGLFWEVNSNTRTAILINGNYLLEKKYGIKPVYIDSFAFENIVSEEVYLRSEKMLLLFGRNGIEYKINGSLRNNTGANIAKCSLRATLIVVYSNEKTFELSDREIVFRQPTLSNLWLPNRSRDFTITTEFIDAEYRNYEPVEALIYFYISAEDAMGYKYDGAFANRDIKKLFANLN